jgi:hypothetical protein
VETGRKDGILQKAGDYMSDITARKVTSEELIRWAAGKTTGKPSKMTAEHAYRCEHSPARTQMFCVDMDGIRTDSSVHIVRHKIWLEHFVSSNRPDRGGNAQANRSTPVNHGLFLNAQALINMSRVRLCRKASPETRQIMEDIRAAIHEVDVDLYQYMVPNCVYRNGICPELKPCGLKKAILEAYDYYPGLFSKGAARGK